MGMSEGLLSHQDVDRFSSFHKTDVYNFTFCIGYICVPVYEDGEVVC